MEILLIHTTASPQIRYGRLQKAAGRTAPLGLACLEAAFPGRLALVDLQHRGSGALEAVAAALDGLLANLWPSPWPRVRAVVVQAASDWTEETSATLAQAIRERFPEARLVLGGEIRRRFLPHWDALVLGTGHRLVAGLLAGDHPSGWSETLAADLREPLPVPASPLTDAAGYTASAEKQITGRTIAVYQPWLGLLDRTQILCTRPPIPFLARLVPWLQRSGFDAVAFAAPVWPAAAYEELQEICFQQRFPFSLAVSDPSEAAAIARLPTGFLDRLWLFPGNREDLLEAFSAIAPRFGEMEVRLGLRLRHDLARSPFLESLMECCEHLSIKLPGEWESALLRRVLVDFYLRQGRLWQHLWRLRSARDLLTFMRGAYGLFDLVIRR
ncbi:MAG: hypothetical protein OZSIB_2652 [Candidatus Ozemobacter sibiricus]|uniref:Uncharacterized protein n=1 Tax=Candidatus Ozemobacter sibiricus TaxID=2268124 RepID=A0A367ZRJ5_9BACT|nr:MAG: hypothetical protein OZSIB_2652 [Candidatus Ozemobacter sibiricus]